MNKAWITGLTLAGVAGSAGAAFAGISTDSQANSPVEAQGLPAETSTTEAAPRTATYQVGAAGTVTVTAANGVLTVDRALPGAFWTVAGYSAPADHVEVQFGDAAQQVTFIAELVNDEIVVSVTNVPAPGATTTSSIEVTEVTDATTTTGAPAPQPAKPASAPIVVAVPAPSPAHTSTASSAGGGEQEHESDDSHEEQHEDEGEDD